MSADAHPPAAPAAGGKSDYKTKLVAVSVGILIVLIFVYYLGATAPMVVDGSTAVVTGTGRSLTRFGAGAQVLANGIRDAGKGVNKVAMELLIAVAITAIVAWIAQLLFKAVKGGGGGGHPPAGQ